MQPQPAQPVLPNYPANTSQTATGPGAFPYLGQSSTVCAVATAVPPINSSSGDMLTLPGYGWTHIVAGAGAGAGVTGTGQQQVAGSSVGLRHGVQQSLSQAARSHGTADAEAKTNCAGVPNSSTEPSAITACEFQVMWREFAARLSLLAYGVEAHGPCSAAAQRMESYMQALMERLIAPVHHVWFNSM